MSFIYSMTDTWNAGGTTFNGIYMNISNGAGGAPVGAAGSRAFRLDANGASIFDINIAGGIVGASSLVVAGLIQAGTNFQWGSGSKVTNPANGMVGVQANGSLPSGLQLGIQTVGTLLSAVTYSGALAVVSDATATTARSIVAGGGANIVVVFSNGTNWLIAA